jgi:hypothetical protein
MSVEHLAVVLHHSKAKGTAKLVLVGIANHAGDGGAYPSVSTLARYANVHPRNVQKALALLVSAGELEVHLQEGGERHWDDRLRPNLYVVKVVCPVSCDRSLHHRDTRRSSTTALPLPNGVATAPPPPGDDDTGGGGDPATLTTHTTPSPQVQDSTTDRARRYCQDCGLDPVACQRRQVHWLEDDRHPYQPGPGRAAG